MLCAMSKKIAMNEKLFVYYVCYCRAEQFEECMKFLQQNLEIAR